MENISIGNKMIASYIWLSRIAHRLAPTIDTVDIEDAVDIVYGIRGQIADAMSCAEFVTAMDVVHLTDMDFYL